MSGESDAVQERRRRLERIRSEIEDEMRAGVTLSAADWRGRHPDLEPELGEMLGQLLGSGPTRVEPARTLPGSEAAATVAINPASVTGSAPPEETVAVSSSEATIAHTQGSSSPASAGQRPPRHTPGVPTPRAPRAGEILGEDATDDEAPDGLTAASDDLTAAPPPSGLDAAGSARGPSPGTKVRYIGDYEILSVLGQGGMGVVYKAKQVTLNRLVALKMIRNAEFAGEDQLRRFQNEAEAVATLDHPGIVPDLRGRYVRGPARISA